MNYILCYVETHPGMALSTIVDPNLVLLSALLGNEIKIRIVSKSNQHRVKKID